MPCLCGCRTVIEVQGITKDFQVVGVRATRIDYVEVDPTFPERLQVVLYAHVQPFAGLTRVIIPQAAGVQCIGNLCAIPM